MFFAIRDFPANWYRIGTAGDRCHDWENTLEVIEAMQPTGKIPVIITKHWIPLTDEQIFRLKKVDAVVNTSTSGLDTDAQTKFRVRQIIRLHILGVKSINRVITCDYGDTEWAKSRKARQDYLLKIKPIIDNPLRADKNNPHVIDGSIILTKIDNAVGGGKFVSLHKENIYLGTCAECPDQCGVKGAIRMQTVLNEFTYNDQMSFLEGSASQDVQWIYVKSVIGSGYEKDVSKLAIEDVIAKEQHKKYWRFHSAIILIIGGEFSGFFTFQNNDISREFCLLQSVIKPEQYTKELYAQMVCEVLMQYK